MKKLLLHFGGNKTGTTSLQNTCLSSFEYLLANKIIYPDFSDVYLPQPPRSHWPLAVYFQNSAKNYYIFKDYSTSEEEVEQFKMNVSNKFLSDIETSDTCLISSEAFGALNIFEMKKVKSYFNSHFDQIETIFYARQPGKYFVSLFQELIKAGHRPDLGDVLKSNVFDQPCQAQNIHKTFGDAATFKIYDKGRLKNNCIVSDIFDHKYLRHSAPPQQVISINQSLTAPAAALQYLLNKYIPRRSEFFSVSKSIVSSVNSSLKKLPKLSLPSQQWEAYINLAVHEKWLNYLALVKDQELYDSFDKRYELRKTICSGMQSPDSEQIENWLMPNLRYLSIIKMPAQLSVLIQSDVIDPFDVDLLRKSFQS